MEQEIKVTGQGTRLSEKAPWETYGEEMADRFTPELAAAVAEYSEKRYKEEGTNNQMKEELHRQQEMSDELSQQYQWLKPEEYEDLGARVGIVMSHAEFITKLRQAGITCHYRQHPHADKAVLYTMKDSASTSEIACWVQIGQMPELSIMNFDEHGVPLAERRRGWRTCLLQIILKGILTKEKADKVFGKPKETEQFHRYNSTLQSFRNIGSRLE